MSKVYTEKKHVLVVSIEPLVLAEIKKELIDSFDVNIAATSATALAALEKYETAAIVIYIGENRDSAFAVFADISETAKAGNIPIMFLSLKGDYQDEADAFAAGAVDYTVRRIGDVSALVSRINLRISASENEKRLTSCEIEAPDAAVSPETILSDKTILVVDDVELNRDLIEGMLYGIEGLTLDFAGDGEEAVEKYKRAPDRYALILMDVQMPVMNGTDATMAIRNLSFENSREIPIIALTAGVEEEEITSYLEAGMNDYIKKPMDYDQLISMVSRYCN